MSLPLVTSLEMLRRSCGVAKRKRMSLPQSDRGPRMHRDTSTVLAIGRQAFVNGSGSREKQASLVDETGTTLGALVDGAEVEIVAWKPRGNATQYFVRTVAGEVTGWLGVAQLRTTREPSAAKVTRIEEPAAVWVPPRQTVRGKRR